MKTKFLLIFFLIFFATPNVFAALRPELAINDDLKICKRYNPTHFYDLPEGWRYYTEQDIKDFKLETLQKKCESLGYIFIDEELAGVLKPYYKNLANILIFGVAILFVVGSLIIFRIYNKHVSKNRKLKLIDYFVIGICCLLFLVLLIFLAFIIWDFATNSIVRWV
jgi:hypothetical protein